MGRIEDRSRRAEDDWPPDSALRATHGRQTHTKLRSASYARQADLRRRFFLRTPQNKRLSSLREKKPKEIKKYGYK